MSEIKQDLFTTEDAQTQPFLSFSLIFKLSGDAEAELGDQFGLKNDNKTSPEIQKKTGTRGHMQIKILVHRFLF